MHFIEVAQIFRLFIGDGRNCHQSADVQRGFFTQNFDCVQQLVGVDAAFCLLPADVHFEQNILPDAVLCGLLGNRFAKMNRTDRLNKRYLPNQEFHLIRLKRTDKLKIRALIGILLIFFDKLLYTVLAADLNACSNCFLNVLCIVHLAGGNQHNILCLSTGLLCCARYTFLYLRDAFMQLHFFLFCHVFTTVLSLRSVPRTMTWSCSTSISESVALCSTI